MSKLTEFLQRTIATDGVFVYNCGYKLLFNQRTEKTSKKLFDVALIGIIGSKHTIELPACFNGIKIKEIHHFTVYDKVKDFNFSTDDISIIPSAFCRNWWDPANNCFPSPAALIPSVSAKCDNIIVRGTPLNAEAFQNLKIRAAKISAHSSKLPARTFYRCDELSDVDLMSDFTEIGRECFALCSKLKQIVLPKSIETIKASAFYHCGLSSIILPNSLKRISDKAFCECYELKFAVIPKSIEYIAPTAFNACPNMTIVSTIGSYGEKYAQKQNLSFIPYESVIAEIIMQRFKSDL